MDGLCKKSEIEKVMNILDYMISEGHQPCTVTYNTLMDGLCKKGEIKKVMDILDDMISIGPQPDIMTYNTLMDGCAGMVKLGRQCIF
jgi:pentatricopeptide repeat protein